MRLLILSALGLAIAASTSCVGDSCCEWESAGVLSAFALTTSDIVMVVKFSPDGLLLAVGDEDYDVSKVKVYDVSNPSLPRLKQTLVPPSEDYILSLAWSPDGTLLAAGDDDYYLTVWSSRNGWRTASQVVHMTPIPACSVVVAEVPDITTGIGHTSHAGCFRLHDMDFSPDGAVLAIASGGTDSRCEGWPDDPPVCTQNKNVVFILLVADWSTGRILDPPLGDDYVTSVAWSPDGSQLVAGDEDNGITIWTSDDWTETGSAIDTQLVTSFIGCTGDCENVGYSPDGQFIVATTGYGHLVAYSTGTWELLMDATVTQYNWVSGGGIKGLAISPDSSTVLVGTDQFNITAEAPCLGGDTSCLGDWSNDENQYGLTAAYTLGAEEPLFEIFGDRDFNTVAYNPSGDVIAAGNDNGKVYLYTSARCGRFQPAASTLKEAVKKGIALATVAAVAVKLSQEPQADPPAPPPWAHPGSAPSVPPLA